MKRRRRKEPSCKSRVNNSTNNNKPVAEVFPSGGEKRFRALPKLKLRSQSGSLPVSFRIRHSARFRGYDFRGSNRFERRMGETGKIGGGGRDGRDGLVSVCACLYPPRLHSHKVERREPQDRESDRCSLLLLLTAIVLLSVERCPPTTHDLGPASLPVLNPAHCFFSLASISREEEDYYLHLDSLSLSAHRATFEGREIASSFLSSFLLSIAA